MFKNLQLKPIYNSYDDNIGEEFYNPILEKAIRFDRVSAYFSAKVLSKYSSGLEYFVKNGSKYRLILSEKISEEDYNLIKKGYELKKSMTENILKKLKEEISLEEKKNISNLAYLISVGIVEIKIAFVKQGIFHDKCGIFYDKYGGVICFRGSNNETFAAMQNNYEAFTVTCNWLLDNNGFYEKIITESQAYFDKLWNNSYKNIITLGAGEVIMNEILKYNRNELIADKVLLKENSLILDYNNQLILKINLQDKKWITSGSFYKIRIKRYVEYMKDDYIFFKKEFSYLDYQKIEEKIESKSKSLKINFHTTLRYKNYIESRNIYIKKRSKLGIDIKNQNQNIEDKFKVYSNIVNNNMSRRLRKKQLWDSFFMSMMFKSGNFSVPGSGKTSSVLGMYSFFKSKDLIKRIVMIGPKSSFSSWIDEFKLCFKNKESLNVFNLHNPMYIRSKDKQRAISLESGNCNLLLFNYESIGKYKNEIINLIDSNTLLVFDEVHKIKRVDGNKPGVYASNALDIAKNANYIVAITGTPIPNSYTDLYNILNLLYKDEYKEFFGLDLEVLKNPNEAELNIINNKIQPFFCRTTKDELSVPSANKDEIIDIYPTEKENRLFDIIMKKYKNSKLTLFIRLLQLESNPQMLLNAIDLSDFEYVLDIDANVDEIDYVDYSDDVKNLIKSMSISPKIKKCISTVKELVSQNKKVIIWCIFKNSIENISFALKENNISNNYIYGDVKPENRLDIIKDFKNGKIDVLITNPHTLGESVSLHDVCHDAIYFEYSYNLVHLLQSKDRIHRLGLDQNQYTQYYYLKYIFEYQGMYFSIDEEIYNRLHEKEKIMLDAIDNNKLENVTSSQEDLDFIFEKLFKD
ncbi:MAG: SNF2-related protein [Peptostreptococcaceae bacterium]|jgi:SNF2 family DNA or RNA helicase|nr:SNF2-related protein [Peptostreptococcaceae bacterium]